MIQPYRFYAQRIDAARNMARYYELSIHPNLFGGASLIRCWGRIGTMGQEKVHLFDSHEQAMKLYLALARRKQLKGYRAMGAQIG